MASPPPPYDESVGFVRQTNSVYQLPPPSYESIYSPGESETWLPPTANTTQARRQAVNRSIDATVIIGCYLVLFAWGATSIYTGVSHLEDCPVWKYTPVSLLVAGCLGCARVLAGLCHSLVITSRRQEDTSRGRSTESNTRKVTKFLIIDLIFFIVCIAVFVQVEFIKVKYESTEGEDSSIYCDGSLVQFTFWCSGAAIGFMVLYFLYTANSLCRCFRQ